MMRACFAAAAACACVLSACSVAPPYSRPQVDMPVTWKVEEPWRESAPNDAAPKGEWWLRFADPELNLPDREGPE